MKKYIINHINAFLSIDGSLKESSKEYYINEEKEKLILDDDDSLEELEKDEIKDFVNYINEITTHHLSALRRIWNMRNSRMHDIMHKTSSFLVDYCKELDIGTIVIGYNKGWKQKVRMGKRGTQNLVSLPFLKMIEMIEYKAELLGIKVVRVSESHTSKCSALENEEIGHHEDYLGKRRPSMRGLKKKENRGISLSDYKAYYPRGLFLSEKGKYINSDVNAAFNIMRLGAPGSLDGYPIKKMLLSPISKRLFQQKKSAIAQRV